MKKLLFLSIATLALIPAKAQQDPMFSQYLYNMLVINPAYAGSRDLLSSTLFYRNQWTGFEGAPVTLNASVHAPFRNNGAWGISVFNDRIGIQSQNMINFNYAYRVSGSKGNLSLGLSGGVYQFSYNYNDLKLDQQNDPLFQGNETHRLFNAGFGAYYQSSKMALGFSVPHLFNRQLFDQTSFRAVNPNNHMFVTGSYILPISNDYRFKPSAMLKYVRNAPLQADLNATIIYKNTLYMGVSYRTYREVSIMVQYQLNKSWWFGYAYDIPFGAVADVSRGSHELFLGFDISFDKSKMLSPRYF